MVVLIILLIIRPGRGKLVAFGSSALSTSANLHSEMALPAV